MKDKAVEKVKNSLTIFNKFANGADECTNANGCRALSHCVCYLDVSVRPVDTFLDVQMMQGGGEWRTDTLKLNDK